MAERGIVDNWTFKDAHLDPNISSSDANKFISAARCILYVAPADKSGATAAKPTFSRVGVVQGYNWSENKQMEMIFELGSDIPYYVPGRTTGQVSVSRILLSGEDMLNLIYSSDSNGKKVDPSNFIRSLRDINIPLNLLFCFYGEGNVGKYDAVYSRLFKNAWIQARSEGISAGQIIVAENVNIVYEFVSSVDYV